jgi:hypothetical protein
MSDTIHLARWYNDRLSPRHDPALAKMVSDATDLGLRRRDQRVANAYHDVDSKLEQISYHAHVARERVRAVTEMIPELLADVSADIGSNPEGHRRYASTHDARVEFYDYALNSHVEVLLIQAKALLDSSAQFYSIAFNRNVRTFSSSGTKILNDVANLGTPDASFAARLGALITSAKELWIDRAIEYRDEVVHFGRLREMQGPVLRLDTRLEYHSADVAPSAMPDGTPLLEYIDTVVTRTHEFASELMLILFDKLRAAS